MTKAELIKALEGFSDDVEICLTHDRGGVEIAPVSHVHAHKVVKVDGGYNYALDDTPTDIVVWIGR